MALQGVNLSLMPLGAEAAWQAALQEEFGLAPDGLADFFPGPAFLAWGRMGNIQGCAKLPLGHRGPAEPRAGALECAAPRRSKGSRAVQQVHPGVPRSQTVRQVLSGRPL
jgi:hypothetical protein